MHDAPTVAIVDDDRDVRIHLKQILGDAGIQVRTFESGQAYLQGSEPDDASCVILDIQMPGMTGVDVFHQMRERRENASVVFLTSHADVPLANELLTEGAEGVLEKPADEDVVLPMIRNGLEHCQLRRRHHVHQIDFEKRLATLTKREREVIEHLIRGKTSKQIGQSLFTSSRTVEVHRRHIMQKMNVQTLSELVVQSVSFGLLDADQMMDELAVS